MILVVKLADNLDLARGSVERHWLCVCTKVDEYKERAIRLFCRNHSLCWGENSKTNYGFYQLFLVSSMNLPTLL